MGGTESNPNSHKYHFPKKTQKTSKKLIFCTPLKEHQEYMNYKYINYKYIINIQNMKTTRGDAPAGKGDAPAGKGSSWYYPAGKGSSGIRNMNRTKRGDAPAGKGGRPRG